MKVLIRLFFAQFFASENVTSDMRLRQSLAFVFAFIVTPCAFLIVSLFPQYTMLTLPTPRRGLGLASIVQFGEVRHRMADDMLEWLVAVLAGYAIVAAGLVAVFVWDSLSFDRRDAMVLGPLPLRDRTVMLAKLAALALFLLGAALALNVVNAAFFGFLVSLRPIPWAVHFSSALVVTTAAAALVFATVVTIRCAAGLVGGARFTSGVGSAMQFLFVAALLVFLVSVAAPTARPGLLRIPETTLSPPVTWFVALFEVLRQSERGSWDEFVTMSRYPLVVVPGAAVLALLTSVAAYRRHMQMALTGAASSDVHRARVTRAVTRLLVPFDRLARATAAFILTTIARSPAQRAPIAINAAIGLGLIVLGLSRTREDATAALLSIPLMAAFWLAIGVRASFFVPSQHPAAWMWFVNAPDRIGSYRAGMRASIVALVAPVTVAAAVAVGGWVHGVVTLAVVVAFAAFLATTIDFVPCTRPYRPGHAKLRQRWPIYLIGAYALSSGVVAIEQRVADDGVDTALFIGAVAAAALAFDVLGRLRPRAWRIGAPGEADDDDPNATLALGLDAAENRPMRAAVPGDAL